LSPIQQGLYVSVVGIVVLFITATIFYFILIGFQAMFPAKDEEEVERVEQKAEDSASIAPPSDEKAVVAAIAVALHLAQSQTIPGLGDSLLENHSAWWSAKLISAHKKSIIR
jgi:Na+-transporting methylmalonyl-CoA/oxaloacetate decarboxylase gamma subunit